MEDAVTLNTLATSAADMARSIDTIWVLIAAALVFFMQAGFVITSYSIHYTKLYE